MQYIPAVLLRQQLLLDSHAHGVTHNFFVLRLPPGIDRAMERERIWPKLTRPEIKNELKEKALRFRRGRGIGESGDRVRDRDGRHMEQEEEEEEEEQWEGSRKWGQIRINEAREGRTRTGGGDWAFFDAKKFPFFPFVSLQCHTCASRALPTST